MRAAAISAVFLAACWVDSEAEFAHDYAAEYCQLLDYCDYRDYPSRSACERAVAGDWLALDQSCAGFDVQRARSCLHAWRERVEDASCSRTVPADCAEVFTDCAGP